LIFLFIWAINYKSDSSEIPQLTPEAVAQRVTQPQIIFPTIMSAKEEMKPKFNEINILEQLDKILDYEPDHEVFQSLKDENTREKILTLRMLLKERHMVESLNMPVGEDLENKILELLQDLKGPDYM
jgi:hypothetical protein